LIRQPHAHVKEAIHRGTARFEILKSMKLWPSGCLLLVFVSDSTSTVQSPSPLFYVTQESSSASGLFLLVVVVVVNLVVPAVVVGIVLVCMSHDLSLREQSGCVYLALPGIALVRTRGSVRFVSCCFDGVTRRETGKEKEAHVPCHHRPMGSCGCGCSGRGTRPAPREEGGGTSAPSARSTGYRR
jgi:hypothetical protein